MNEQNRTRDMETGNRLTDARGKWGGEQWGKEREESS